MVHKKTILVTGSTGFIGRNIVEFLQPHHLLLTPTHRDLDLLSQKEVHNFFHDHDIEYVIHCASIGGSRKKLDNKETVEHNLRMFFNLTENQDRFQTLIHLGSGAEYDKSRILHNVHEEEFGKFIPGDNYGFSKYIISKYIEKTENVYCLRLFGIFGRYEDYEFKFISNAIVKNLLHLPITIRQNVCFSWLYIDDFLKILNYFLTHTPKHRTYNITPPDTCDLLSIARMINAISDYTSEICIETEGLNIEYSANNSRLINEIGGFSFTPMKKSVSRLRDYYKMMLHTINQDAIRQDPYLKFCRTYPIR
ncbi:MAG: NAD-dependent epimerase/dehydratase family protein [Methanomicrobiales archaeon]|jgi:GDP-L-fucose synthase